MNNIGLIAHYPLSRRWGAFDASGNGNNGVITPGTGGYTKDQIGRAGMAYEFDGANTKIDTGSDFIGTSALTISCWIYPNTMGEGNTAYKGMILNNGSLAIEMYDAGTKRLIVLGKSSPTNTALSSHNSIVLGAWQHIVVTVSGSTVAFYINGVSLTADSSIDILEAGTTNVIIGNNNNQSRTFDGTIANLRIYNRIVTPTEINHEWRRYKNLRIN